uniref:Fibroblast growth factor binding protein 2a n=1 Tax=Seriola dumerili TaxID=41447 RepID=A0A3B4TXU3_SERDU
MQGDTYISQSLLVNVLRSQGNANTLGVGERRFEYETVLIWCLAKDGTATEAQSDGSRRQSIWDDPIQFNTKANDLCTMIITGHGEYTRLRVSCQSSKRSYWCEYVGKPYTCRSYNKNPRHYFVQMMWDFRKLHNACWPARPQPRPEPTRPDSVRQASTKSFQVPTRVKTTQRTTPQPPTLPVESNAKRMARQYCWRSLQGICSFVIGLPAKSCQPGNKKLAEEYCDDSWSSFCTFFFTMVQDYDC